MAHVAAQQADLLHEAGCDELVAVGRHQEHRLDGAVQAGVHAGHLELILEVRHRAQATDDDRGAAADDEIHQQVVERADLDLDRLAVQRLDLVAHDLHALVDREERPFPAFRATPMISRSTSLVDRWMMSEWPLVIGSKVPG